MILSIRRTEAVNRTLTCVFVLFATAALAQDGIPKASVTRWPQDRAAAISLTFDDGIDTDLDFVEPILAGESHRASSMLAPADHATFAGLHARNDGSRNQKSGRRYHASE